MIPSSPRTFRRRPVRVLAALIATAAVLAVMTALPGGADVSFINSRRTSAGLSPVQNSGGLASLAASHSQQMADRGELYHSSGLGSRVSTVFSNWQAVAENVGVGESVEAVNSMFMQSASHRANILGSFTHAGVGVATGGDGRVWVTQVFARVPTTSATTTPTIAAASAPAPRPVAERTTAPRVSRSAPRAPAVEPPPAPKPREPLATAAFGSALGGYHIVTDDGGVFSLEGANFAGSAVGLLSSPPVAGAETTTGDGYVLFGADGSAYAFGAAEFSGGANAAPLNAPMVGAGLTPTGKGYWMFSADGGVFTFGDAPFYGALAGTPLASPIVAAAATPSGRGYLLVARDGAVFSFGDAPFLGGLNSQPLNAGITAAAITTTGKGYWLVGADGGVFAFGDAVHAGGLSPSPDAPPRTVAIVAAHTGKGYWIVTDNKDAVGFGDVSKPAPEPTHPSPRSSTRF